MLCGPLENAFGDFHLTSAYECSNFIGVFGQFGSISAWFSNTAVSSSCNVLSTVTDTFRPGLTKVVCVSDGCFRVICRSDHPPCCRTLNQASSGKEFWCIQFSFLKVNIL